jgi:hypothetical protein
MQMSINKHGFTCCGIYEREISKLRNWQFYQESKTTAAASRMRIQMHESRIRQHQGSSSWHVRRSLISP